MLKFLFGFFVLINGALFAYNAGYLGAGNADGREPARMTNQLNAERIRLVAPPDPTPAAVVPVALPAATLAQAASTPPVSQKCIEIGDFDTADARRFDQLLVPLALGERLSRRTVGASERYIVYIPPLADKESADRKAGELRRLGIDDFFVFAADSDLQWGISLGLFKTEDAARLHLASLTLKGVRSAKLATRAGPAGKSVYQLRGLDADTQAEFGKIRLGFPRQEIRDC